MKHNKTLKDLNLLDRFLFAEAADDPEFMELVLEIILGKEIVLKHLPQTEKENRAALWSSWTYGPWISKTASTTWRYKTAIRAVFSKGLDCIMGLLTASCSLRGQWITIVSMMYLSS